MISIETLLPLLYYVISYVIMLFASLIMVGTIHKPSLMTKLFGLFLFLLAPITLPVSIIIIFIINIC